MKFKLSKHFIPKGDQPQAIAQLVDGIKNKDRFQTLLGVTGSGKTFTIANVIEKIQKPTLIISHNKTLAAQLCQEMREFFPENAVEYFVSYYDYYQPEAYVSTTDTYIEKEVQLNEEIDRLRHSATSALLTRKDVIVVASVSCIYGLGIPEEYRQAIIILEIGKKITREELINQLISLYYSRSEVLAAGKFRSHGPVIEVVQPNREIITRIELQDNKIIKIVELDLLTKKLLETHKSNEVINIFPAKHFIVGSDILKNSVSGIKHELAERIKYFKNLGKITEAERIERRTKYDLEMMQEIGYCNGIENYSRYLTNRAPGQAPYTLLDYFDKDFLIVIDESHVTVPQIQGMYAGDKARKTSLIDYGFRLPSALDNRPLQFSEFENKINQAIFVSATPAKYEAQNSKKIVNQIIRPTGLIDPEIIIRPAVDQVENAINEIQKETSKGNRVLVTTLTKKMAEDLADFLKNKGVKAEYLHSEVETLDRIRILTDLRAGKFDCLVGVNLLREGLDLPEVSLVCILDADKEGFLRSTTSLIQTMGRAARNINGRVILYADKPTSAINSAVAQTNNRRKMQIEYNKKNNITPQSVKKAINSIAPRENQKPVKEFSEIEQFEDIPKAIKVKEKEMKKLAKELRFEEALLIRDEISTLKKIIRIR